MKKIKFVKYILTAFLLTSFLSCEVGLGPGVDMTAPVIELTSHKDNDSVAGVFTLRGTAYDNQEVSGITIDFEDADIHFKVLPGSDWQKKTSASPDWVTIDTDTSNYCTKNGDKWKWSIDVDTSDKSASKEGNTFVFTAVAQDAMGNAGRNSKTDCSLIVDTQSPSVSIISPELKTGTYNEVAASVSSYAPKDPAIKKELLNGDITIQGRQEDALSFKALYIEFDNGQLQSGVRKSTIDAATSVESLEEILALNEANFDTTPPTLYYRKQVTGDDLRVWQTTIKQSEWVNDTSNPTLKTGKHIIRVVSTSLSTSNAWERKVLGYFVWFPEADSPWITSTIGDDTEKQEAQMFECYPGSDFVGSINDDDGIKEFKSTVYKKNSEGGWDVFTQDDYENPKIHTLPSVNADYAAWSFKVPSQNGIYRAELSVTDMYNKTETINKYFKTADVSAPKITITGPTGDSAILAANGDITFSGKVEDDGLIKNFVMVWLNPAKANDPSNKIQYITGTDITAWNLATDAGYTDSNGNKLYKFSDAVNKSSYNFSKKFNLYSSFGINGTNKLLTTQEFVFWAYDGTTPYTKVVTLKGDIKNPDFSFTNITLSGKTELIGKDSNGNDIAPPTFPKQNSTATATITGKWDDKFNDTFANTSRFAVKKIEWGTGTNKKTAEITLNTNKTWTATIAPPNGGGTITATLQDFGGNTVTIQTAVRIETSDIGIARIGCLDNDGAYKAGKKLNITLEFTKNTTCNTAAGTPSLTMNAGETATYKSGTGTTTHVYEYTVPAGTTNFEKLNVTAINANGAKWYDSAVTGDSDPLDNITFGNIPPDSNLEDTRNISIDRTAPRVNNITVVSADGSYKAGDTIMFLMEFTEGVKITNPSNLKLQFKHKNGNIEVKTTKTTESGSYVLFEYTIADGDAEGDTPVTLQFDKIISTTIEDTAGNSLTNWTPITTPDFSTIKVDTKEPDAPQFKVSAANNAADWSPDRIIFAPETTNIVTSFFLKGESDATMEYSLDDGASWLPYPTTGVDFRNNGTYKVKARQTDKAGNEGPESNTITFTIDKGELLKRITAKTVSGVYSLNTTTKTIQGVIEFRKNVKLPKNASVTLNISNSTAGVTSRSAKIEECKNDAKTSKTFTFEYTIVEGDSVDKLDVTDWTFKTKGTNGLSYTIDGVTLQLDMPLPAATDGKRFKNNRDIKILTGKPTIEDLNEDGVLDITLTGEGSATRLNIPFDREVTKTGGNIVLTQSTTGYRVPAVLSVEEYNALRLTAAKTVIEANYHKDVNGATKDSNNKPVNDTTTKYVLNYDKTVTDTALVTAFTTTAKQHIITIPVVADEVTIETNNGKSVMVIDLGGTYKLPVKGASYSISIPANIVTDVVQNKNDSGTITLTAPGVEPPVIRTWRPSYTITGAGNTKTAAVNYSDMQSPKVKIDCRTPEATIKYNTNQTLTNGDNVKTMNKKDTYLDTKTTDPSVPTTINKTYTAEITNLATGTGYGVDSYANAFGVKIALAATATANGQTSAPAYEYLTRTVLKLNIGSYNTNANDGGRGSTAPTTLTSKYPGLTFRDLKVWVFGGDAPYGGNTNDPFPLAWADSRYFKLMSGTYSNNDTNDMKGSWYWVSWDITAPTYHGFAIGTVPSDALENGPDIWYAAECSWVSQKTNFVLRPGETLVMDTTNVNPTFLFRDKNEATNIRD